MKKGKSKQPDLPLEQPRETNDEILARANKALPTKILDIMRIKLGVDQLWLARREYHSTKFMPVSYFCINGKKSKIYWPDQLIENARYTFSREVTEQIKIVIVKDKLKELREEINKQKELNNV